MDRGRPQPKPPALGTLGDHTLETLLTTGPAGRLYRGRAQSGSWALIQVLPAGLMPALDPAWGVQGPWQGLVQGKSVIGLGIAWREAAHRAATVANLDTYPLTLAAKALVENVLRWHAWNTTCWHLHPLSVGSYETQVELLGIPVERAGINFGRLPEPLRAPEERAGFTKTGDIWRLGQTLRRLGSDGACQALGSWLDRLDAVLEDRFTTLSEASLALAPYLRRPRARIEDANTLPIASAHQSPEAPTLFASAGWNDTDRPTLAQSVAPNTLDDTHAEPAPRLGESDVPKSGEVADTTTSDQRKQQLLEEEPTHSGGSSAQNPTKADLTYAESETKAPATSSRSEEPTHFGNPSPLRGDLVAASPQRPRLQPKMTLDPSVPTGTLVDRGLPKRALQPKDGLVRSPRAWHAHQPEMEGIQPQQGTQPQQEIQSPHIGGPLDYAHQPTLLKLEGLSGQAQRMPMVGGGFEPPEQATRPPIFDKEETTEPRLKKTVRSVVALCLLGALMGITLKLLEPPEPANTDIEREPSSSSESSTRISSPTLTPWNDSRLTSVPKHAKFIGELDGKMLGQGELRLLTPSEGSVVLVAAEGYLPSRVTVLPQQYMTVNLQRNDSILDCPIEVNAPDLALTWIGILERSSTQSKVLEIRGAAVAHAADGKGAWIVRCATYGGQRIHRLAQRSQGKKRQLRAVAPKSGIFFFDDQNLGAAPAQIMVSDGFTRLTAKSPGGQLVTRWVYTSGDAEVQLPAWPPKRNR